MYCTKTGSASKCGKNPYEDGSVAYKCYIFIAETKNMELNSDVFFGKLKSRYSRALTVSCGEACPDKKARSSEKESQIAN